MMTTLLRLQDFDTSDSASFLYTLSAAYLDHTEQAGDEEMSGLNDEQHTLTALCYLDSQVQEGGFVQLIASGYGEYIFGNPVTDSLRCWRIKPIPKILEIGRASCRERVEISVVGGALHKKREGRRVRGEH